MPACSKREVLQVMGECRTTAEECVLSRTWLCCLLRTKTIVKSNPGLQEQEAKKWHQGRDLVVVKLTKLTKGSSVPFHILVTMFSSFQATIHSLFFLKYSFFLFSQMTPYHNSSLNLSFTSSGRLPLTS